MQPPKNSEELAEIYPYLEPQQKDEIEECHRGWITKMTGDVISEEYNSAIPPPPDSYHPED